MPTLGEAIDDIYADDLKIRALMAKVAAIKKRQALKEAKLLKRLENQKMPACAGRTATASIRVTQHVNVKDRGKVDAYVRKYKAYDLFTNHINQRAYFDRLEAGEKVPGLDVYERRSLSITKREDKGVIKKNEDVWR